MMKAITYLNEIKAMDARINAGIAELSRLKTLATKTTSVMGDERVQSSGSQQKMADCVTKIVALEEQITNEIDRYVDYKNEARKLICKCDNDCIDLLYKRYFEDKSWERISCEMDFTYKYVSGKLHRKALEQLQKYLDEKDGE